MPRADQSKLDVAKPVQLRVRALRGKRFGYTDNEVVTNLVSLGELLDHCFSADSPFPLDFSTGNPSASRPVNQKSRKRPMD